jgi:penicillin-binding protein 1A
VLSGTGRAAQIGRPVAGKTGTTTSNKDGWFIGFSSGLTTGVWMGRDDAKPVPGLQGGTAPARAFHDFMVVAVARRPVVPFETEAPLPDWQLEPDEDVWGNLIDEAPLVDADGNPIEAPATAPVDPLGAQPDSAAQPGDSQWLDSVMTRPAPPPAQPPVQPGGVPPAPPASARQVDPLQPRPESPQR